LLHTYLFDFFIIAIATHLHSPDARSTDPAFVNADPELAGEVLAAPTASGDVFEDDVESSLIAEWEVNADDFIMCVHILVCCF
jgi:hypothetical protein